MRATSGAETDGKLALALVGSIAMTEELRLLECASPPLTAEEWRSLPPVATSRSIPPLELPPSAAKRVIVQANDRRHEPRYKPNVDRLWMQWWDEGECFGLPARLVNVSRHGALILTSVRFKERQRVRLFLEDIEFEVSVDSSVVGLILGTRGWNQVRLSFDTNCPDEFLEAAADGFEEWLVRGSR